MPAFIRDIAEEHYEELQFLWSQRRNALYSAAYTMREMGMLEERIEAHTQGLLVLGEDLLDFLEPGLAGKDELAAFASAFVLLRLGTPAAIERVSDAFRSAEGKRLAGLRDALANGPAQPLFSMLHAQFTSAEPPIAVAAGEALAFHRALNILPEQLVPLLRDKRAAVRQGAWRIVVLSGMSLPAPLYEAGLRDDEPSVQRAASVAAAWNGYAGWLPFCRNLAAQPTPEGVDAIAMLAAVLPPQEYQAVTTLASTSAFGPRRHRIAAAFGHPVMVEYLLKEMESEDPAAAAGAAAAFGRMLGVAVESGRRATIPPPSGAAPDDFDAEFLEEVRLPDLPRARREWEQLRPKVANASRVARGIDVSAGLTREIFGQLDMESRHELCLRARLTAGWTGTPLVLEQFPLRG